jgi:hypothetical protein
MLNRWILLTAIVSLTTGFFMPQIAWTEATDTTVKEAPAPEAKSERADFDPTQKEAAPKGSAEWDPTEKKAEPKGSAEWDPTEKKAAPQAEASAKWDPTEKPIEAKAEPATH